MSLIQHHKTIGRIASSAGAAAAELRLQAAVWAVEVDESDGDLTLALWGCVLRLSRSADGAVIAISGPERRLVDTLRDAATEVMGRAGLTVAWDRVDTGALAPGLTLARVVAVRRISAGFWRVRVAADDLARFAASQSLHFRLLLPRPGRAPVWPRVAATGRTVWPEAGDSPHRAVYTVSGWDRAGTWIDFDVFLHADSPTCDWIASGPFGQTVGILGPGGGGRPDAAKLFLFGDETALPAIARMLGQKAGQVVGPGVGPAATVCATLRATPQDAALIPDPRVTRCDDLLAALIADRVSRNPVPGGFVWFAGRADQARAARAHLLDHGWQKRDMCCAAYWD